MEGSGADCEEDRFTHEFKYFKRKQPPPDLSHVIQVDDFFKEGEQILPCSITKEEEEYAEEVGLNPHLSWKIYSVNCHPGLLFIRNPFTSQGQLQWIKRCLREFPCAANKTNLTSHGITLAADTTWWQLAQTIAGKESGIKKKLRWVTLGYHHNWDTKEYSECLKGEMPVSLVKLCGVVSNILGFKDFHAEAAIINYYHRDSTLAPHTDHSEPYTEAPLFSFSFGQSALFLIGGPRKATKPSAIFLHSGDIMVMTGLSRQAYHAVPRVLLVAEEPWNASHNEVEVTEDIYEKERYTENKFSASNDFSNKVTLNIDCGEKEGIKGRIFKDNNDDIEDILNYVKSCRINMNVRQVLAPSMNKLPK
ncbi:nucleic acid dioxygenase ALKBH1 [Procambarus clarkii]|uniref:nucleic acid dioxygenase ALKBH1 n=1 Tax=Procambarus clarkii TaxID=6728 RepID=UPI001E677596|nr:nucleic acid dioxygenase ALKBH1-like [Procambarus clarkii]